MTVPIITVENSAPSQIIPAKSVIKASEILKSLGVKSVVDFGCGRLRNLTIYSRQFHSITLVDTKLQCEKILKNPLYTSRHKLCTDTEFSKINQKYDAVFLIMVLHIIPEENKRIEILKAIVNKLNIDGFLVVDVPTGEKYYRNKCSLNNKFLDGWIMKNGTTNTFYKQYTAIELDNFITNNSHLKLLRKISLDKHLVRIFKNSG
jgi:hypothetical protein